MRVCGGLKRSRSAGFEGLETHTQTEFSNKSPSKVLAKQKGRAVQQNPKSVNYHLTLCKLTVDKTLKV